MSDRQGSKQATLVFRILPPGECSAQDLQSFSRLVRQGGQVQAAGLEARISNAARLGFARCGNRLAGVAALKNPRPTYQSKVFAAAAESTLAHRFSLEFGWVVVAPPFQERGIAKTLSRRLMETTTKVGVFATTGVENEPMQRILRYAGFEVVGQPFPSSRAGTSNRLWVRPGIDPP
jgi:ribosomal protein S18 acetylase RimI-like enzyme